jgi:protein tyrosine phosphatase (PTP) superfamily phosphohydrolase (DUF442 family)
VKFINTKKIIVRCLAIIAVLIIGGISRKLPKGTPELAQNNDKPVFASATPSVSLLSPTTKPALSPAISFVGPRGNVPAGAPKDYGFWSFAIPVPGVLSRSGQPLLAEFKWLRENGWRGDVDLRADGEYNEVSDDSKIPGFSQLGFHYLYLPMADGSHPTDTQAEQFLAFATNPDNQPLHVHCRGGIGRAGVMVAIYRYSVQGWPMASAIEESRPFQGGVSASQEKWLLSWAATHKPASFAK